jgi:hypothetical protein
MTPDAAGKQVLKPAGLDKLKHIVVLSGGIRQAGSC